MIDVAIIGAGITGSAIARELAKYNLNVVVFEKGLEVCQGTTKANSAIVHGGYDAKEGTLKAKFNVAGNALYGKLCEELDVAFKRIGSLVLAFDEEEARHVEALYERGQKNGAKGLRVLDKEEILKIEPYVNPQVVKALLCESTGVVCPFNLNIALMENAIANGVTLKLKSKVTNITKEGDVFNLEVGQNERVQAHYVVNAAGVYADEINNMVNGEAYAILPRKGEYKILEKSEGKRAKHVLFQCPTKKGKGVLVTQTVHGNLMIGPNATDVADKEDISTTKEGILEIVTQAKKSVPSVDFRKTITSFAGLRAVPSTGDFCVFASAKSKGFINAGGLESPGLTSAPALAEYVVELLAKEGLVLQEKTDFNPFRPKNKAFHTMTHTEKEDIIQKDSRYKNIICRCEMITEGEIVEAIHSPCGARTVDGVKRRVRSGMGRCQGGFCGPKVMAILARELDTDLEKIKKDYCTSNVVIGKAKELRGEKDDI